MINSSISIIGIGLIGSNLAIGIAKDKLTSKISLYDYSVTSNENYFPFKNSGYGIRKIDIVTYNIFKVNKNIEVKCYYDMVMSSVKDELVIDCRDYKKPNIYADVRISSDSHSLILDARRNIDEVSHPFYYSKADCSKWINIQVPYIILYLKRKEYFNNYRLLIDFKDNISVKI
jgi:hypothetical protein